jgi:flagellar biosynthetic protein FliO
MSDLAREQPSFGSSLGLSFLLLGCLCLVGWGLIRFLGRRRPVGRNGMRVVCRVSLEPRRSVLLLEAGGRGFLLGSAENGISLIAEMDPTMFESVESGRKSEARVESPNSGDVQRPTGGGT